MTVSVKKQGLKVPATITREAGIKPGDLVDVTVRRGTITVHAAVQPDENRIATYTPTKAEAAAIRKGRAAFERGDFVSLDELRKKLDAAGRGSRKKAGRKAS